MEPEADQNKSESIPPPVQPTPEQPKPAEQAGQADEPKEKQE